LNKTESTKKNYTLPDPTARRSFPYASSASNYADPCPSPECLSGQSWWCRAGSFLKGKRWFTQFKDDAYLADLSEKYGDVSIATWEEGDSHPRAVTD
jgi:hypothetical protein